MESIEEVIGGLRSLRDAKIGKETAREQLPVLMRQLGEISKSVLYMTAYPADVKLYRSFLNEGCADLLIQLLMFAQEQGFPLDGILSLGAERFREKMREVSHK